MLIQDGTQGNREGGTVPPPATAIVDDSTGKEDGLPLNPDIAQALVAAGLPAMAPGRGNNSEPGDNATPGTAEANTDQQKYFADVATEAIIPTFKQQGRPLSIVYWSRDLDGTQHNQGDSLNELTPGINGPTSKAAVKNADDNLKQILDTHEAQVWETAPTSLLLPITASRRSANPSWIRRGASRRATPPPCPTPR